MAVRFDPNTLLLTKYLNIASNSKYKEDIEVLRSEGRTYNEISALLGCSKSTISYYIGVGQKYKNKMRKLRFREKYNMNPNYIKAYYRLRKTLEKNKISLSKDEFEIRYPLESKCYLTGDIIDLNLDIWEFDHVIPRSKGGENTLENLKVVKKSVNRIKHDLSVNELIDCCKKILKHNGYSVSSDIENN